ncbi:MAG: hypothetical protein O6948_00815, partial [Deltaproteobacteria bacterium]|nr:hypothetical protein [Deltaproteobacteria bacterium]
CRLTRCPPSHFRPITRPGVLFWLFDRLGSGRVQFDVPALGQQIGLNLDRIGFVSAFPQCSTSACESIDVP